MFEVEINDHWSKLISSIQHSFESQKGTNCVLRCEGKEIRCHKYVLTAFSRFFDPLQENESMLITNVKFKQLQTLVNAIYYGRVKVAVDEFPKLVKKAQKLGFEQLFSSQLREKCQELLGNGQRMVSDEEDENRSQCRNEDEMNFEDTLRAIKSLNEFSTSQECVEECEDEENEGKEESESDSANESNKMATLKMQTDASKHASVSPSYLPITKSDSGAFHKPNFDINLPSEGNFVSVSNHSSKSQSQVTLNTSSFDVDDDSQHLSSQQVRVDNSRTPEEITVSIAPNDLVATKDDSPIELKHNPQCLQTRRSSNPSSIRYLKSGPSSPSAKPITINITSQTAAKSALSPSVVPNTSLVPSLTITSLPSIQSLNPSVTLTSSASSSKQKPSSTRMSNTPFAVAPRLSTATSITIVSQTESPPGPQTSKPQILSQLKKPNGRKSIDVDADESTTGNKDATQRSIQKSSSPSTYVQSGIVLISSEPGPSHGKKNPQRAARSGHLSEGMNAYAVDLTDEHEYDEEEDESEEDDDNWDDFRIDDGDDDWRNGRSSFQGTRSALWTGEGPLPKKRRTRDPRKFKNRFPCPECGKILANFYYKEEHVRIKHQKQNLLCTEVGCNFEVLERDKFNEHLKKAHGKEIKRGRPKSDP